MYCSKRVVTSDHDNTMAALVQHPDGLDRIILERTLQDQETSKVQFALNLLALEIVDAVLANLITGRQVLVRKCKNTSTVPAEVLERLFVLRWHVDQHLSDGLWCALDTDEGTLVSSCRLTDL